MKLCGRIRNDREMDDMSFGYAEALGEELGNCAGVLLNLFYEMPGEREWCEEEEG